MITDVHMQGQNNVCGSGMSCSSNVRGHWNLPRQPKGRSRYCTVAFHLASECWRLRGRREVSADEVAQHAVRRTVLPHPHARSILDHGPAIPATTRQRQRHCARHARPRAMHAQDASTHALAPTSRPVALQPLWLSIVSVLFSPKPVPSHVLLVLHVLHVLLPGLRRTITRSSPVRQMDVSPISAARGWGSGPAPPAQPAQPSSASSASSASSGQARAERGPLPSAPDSDM